MSGLYHKFELINEASFFPPFSLLTVVKYPKVWSKGRMWFILGMWPAGCIQSLRWEKWDSCVIARAGVSPQLVNDWNAVPFPPSAAYLEVMFENVGFVEDRWNFVPKGLLESYWWLTFFIRSSHQSYKVGDFIPFNLLMKKLEHRELISPRTGR